MQKNLKYKSRSKTNKNNHSYLKNKTNKKKGGSLASAKVLEAVNGNKPNINGYKDNMHLPTMDNLKGGSLASNNVLKTVNSNSPELNDYKDNMDLPTMNNLKGGSRASDRLSSFMTDKNTQPKSELLNSNNEYINETMKGFNTETYQLTGGNKHNKNKKQLGGGVLKDNLALLIETGRKNPSVPAKTMVQNYLKGMPMRNKLTEKQLIAKLNTTSSSRSLQKGGNFLSLAGCGPVNVPDAGRQYAGNFSKTSMCPGPEWYANPPNLGSAGSGLDDLGVGAPVL